MYDEVTETEEDHDPLPVRKETGPLMFLSLFLLLLAFFILLNSISTPLETRSRDVLSSVAATFQTETDPDQRAEILVSTIGAFLEPEQVIDEVERLWLSEIPFVKIDYVTRGQHILVEFPVTQLFVGTEPALRGDRRDLISATAHVLSNRLQGQVVQMQGILFVRDMAEVPDAPPRRAPGPEAGQTVDIDDPGAALVQSSGLEGTELSFARALTLTRALTDGGAPPDSVAIGLREGNESRIRFRFFIRDADRARMTFTEGAAPPGGQP